MKPRFEQFIRERQYLTNVPPATLEWYRNSLNWQGTENPASAKLLRSIGGRERRSAGRFFCGR
jgi:hypothetical protein